MSPDARHHRPRARARSARQRGAESPDLSRVDSGDYHLAIGTWYDPAAAPCATVMISYELTPAQQVLSDDGVFRSGINAAPDP